MALTFFKLELNANVVVRDSACSVVLVWQVIGALLHRGLLALVRIVHLLHSNLSCHSGVVLQVLSDRCEHISQL